MPKNLQQIQAFIGLASYYRKFIAMFAAIAHPLIECTQKSVGYAWTDECQEACMLLQ
jgi:hypothetical protein